MSHKFNSTTNDLTVSICLTTMSAHIGERSGSILWPQFLVKFDQKYFRNKLNTELQWTNLGTKITGEISFRGRISHLMPKMDFYFHRFSWEKNTLKCHMPWLYP